MPSPQETAKNIKKQCQSRGITAKQLLEECELGVNSQSAPIDKALYFGILPIYRAFLRLLCAIFLILCKVFLTGNNAFLTRIAHEIAHGYSSNIRAFFADFSLKKRGYISPSFLSLYSINSIRQSGVFLVPASQLSTVRFEM